MFDPNDFEGSDSERIAAAVAAASQSAEDRRVVISRRHSAAEPERDFWLIDEAVRLPGGIEVVIQDCRIKLSDRCRDNFFRSANCGEGIERLETLRGIRLTGRGGAVLEGADHPRSTGDSAKTLGVRSYGTDAGRPEVSQTGDWRNIGILFAKVEDFCISGLTIRNYHCWGVSLEKCSRGRVANLIFDTRERREIDGVLQPILNQDGVDLRKGCHHIEIENITGRTGDDLVALTAISPDLRTPGLLDSTEVSGRQPGDELDLHHVTIRHVHGYSTGGHQIVRLLNSQGIRIYSVLVEDVCDLSAESPDGIRDNVAVKIGDVIPAWGGVAPLGDTFDITVRDIDSRARHAVLVQGTLCLSRIENVINRNPDCPPFECRDPEGVRAVTVVQVRTVPESF